MTEPENRECRHPEHHRLHVCQLKKRGLSDEVKARTDNPKYICHNCNIVANEAEDLCNCSPLVNKP